jgi:diguanylate cyclase (GGDEF)-like protein
MSLLMLDIDFFKQFNDQYGHQFGDDCLRAVATAITSAIRRDIDLVARYGGDEIAAVLASTDAEGALIVAEKVRQAVFALNIPHAGNPGAGGVVTVSIGAATALARHGGTMKMPESLLMSADHALYKAKHEGRNRVSATLLMATQEAQQPASAK